MSTEIGKRLRILPVLLSSLLVMSCENNGPIPPTTYERILIDTYQPQGGLPLNIPADTYLSLFNASGSLLAADDDGNTDSGQNGSSRIDDTSGLTSGTYYIKITKGPGSANIGAYAVRLLSLALADPIPAYPASFDVTSDPYEGQDAPEAAPPVTVTPMSMPLGTDNLGRILGTVSDVDWLYFVLP